MRVNCVLPSFIWSRVRRSTSGWFSFESNGDGPANQATEGMLNSVEMVQYFSRLLGGIVLVVCSVFVPAVSLFGEERSHPSLVDPAITKCTVCHTPVASTHPGIAASQGCLSCHTLIEKSGKTLLIAEANSLPPGVDEPMAMNGSANGAFKQEGAEGDAPLDETVRGSQPSPPPAETAAAAASVVEHQPSSTVRTSEGEGTVRSGGSYGDGMQEFNRGDFDSAFQTWSSMLADNPDHFTLQVEVDTYFITVQSTIARYGNHSLYVLKNDNLYFVFSGLFATLAEANDALKSLPEPLQRGGAFPVSVRRIELPE